MNSQKVASTDFLDAEVRAFRLVRKGLSQEQMDSAEDLKKFQQTIFSNEDEYKKRFEGKIFVYQKKYYKYSFDFGIKTKFVGENLILCALINFKPNCPDINDFKTEVSSASYFLVQQDSEGGPE